MSFERRLIKKVKGCKCLYESQSRANISNQTRYSEWQRISEALKKPVTECRLRWRSLRDRFVREKRKIDSDKLSPNSELWEYFEDMRFLLPSVRQRKVKGQKLDKDKNSDHTDEFVNVTDEGSHSEVNGNLSYDEMFDAESSTQQGFHIVSTPYIANEEIISDDEEYYTDQKFESQQHNEVDDELIEDDFDKYPTIRIPESLASENRREMSQTFEKIPTSPVKLSSTSTNTPDSSSEAFIEFLNSLKTELNQTLIVEKDENDLFLECMAKKMKKLSPRAKFKIQAKLLECITQELLKEMDQEERRSR